MSTIGIASEFPLLLHLFTAYEHKHRCYIPGCDDKNETFRSNNYTSFALPQQSSNNEVFDESSGFDSCKMYPQKITTNYSNDGPDLCILESFDNNSTISCDSYVYDTSLFPESFTIYLDLVSVLFYGLLRYHY